MPTKQESLFSFWFSTMLTRPAASQATKVARFHELTGLFIYVIAGLSMLITPFIWEFCLSTKFGHGTEGYFRLVGVEVVVIGFNYVLTGRASLPVSQGQGHILCSIPERMILVNGCLLMLILRDMIPLSFGVIFMTLDTFLAFITYLIWFKETENATLSCFFSIIERPLLKPFSNIKNSSTLSVLFVGVLQFFAGFLFTVKPSLVFDMLGLKEAQDNKVGFLGAFFFASVVNGFFHLYMGKADSLSFNIGAMFYRLLFIIPVSAALFAVGKIELNLCLFTFCVNFVLAMVILVALCSQSGGRNSETSSRIEKNRK